ncbi:hypothetical protein GCM10011512_25030 [Tersicoccus solisilvae]|uniref:Uncharacterized protein n=1 Tax=Tersicoccus solisilvae TaxID=1882339 RepID=A0ABQ1PGM9_9MICC|nr:hypothetical protein GCM10011512_25030 [Tersicoccus solisilvae]
MVKTSSGAGVYHSPQNSTVSSAMSSPPVRRRPRIPPGPGSTRERGTIVTQGRPGVGAGGAGDRRSREVLQRGGDPVTEVDAVTGPQEQ